LIEDLDLEGGSAALVPVTVDGHTLYLSARRLVARSAAGSESEIAAYAPTLDEALGSLGAFAQQLAARLQPTDASRVSVEFGCEFAVESGKFIAVIGKASAKSAVKVGLEWTRPEP
jgi:hypothetical protein